MTQQAVGAHVRGSWNAGLDPGCSGKAVVSGPTKHTDTRIPSILGCASDDQNRGSRCSCQSSFRAPMQGLKVLPTFESLGFGHGSSGSRLLTVELRGKYAKFRGFMFSRFRALALCRQLLGRLLANTPPPTQKKSLNLSTQTENFPGSCFHDS